MAKNNIVEIIYWLGNDTSLPRHTMAILNAVYIKAHNNIIAFNKSEKYRKKAADSLIYIRTIVKLCETHVPIEILLFVND